MRLSVVDPDRQLRDRERLRGRIHEARVLLYGGRTGLPETETERVLDDEALMESIHRGREQRRRGETGTSLEDARREILGEDG
jgi:hypothetical protein